jgi:TetR/AcrR family transcriptional repressor of nem operon
MAALSSDLPRMSDASRQQFAAGVQRVTTALGEQLDALGRADAEAGARSMMAELIGALSLARVELDAKRSDAILAASRGQLKQRFGLPS